MTTQNYNKLVKIIAEHIITDIQNEYMINGKVVTADIRDSWKIDYKNNTIYSTNEGAYYLEHGRPPNRRPPPIGEIIKWCSYRGIPLNRAYAIRRDIGRRGIPATNIIQEYCKKNNLKYTHESG